MFFEQKEKTSQYKGVCWHKINKKWVVIFDLKEQLPKYGGCFNDELDAAKRVNELCKELGIPEKNPGIGTLYQKWKVTQKLSHYIILVYIWNNDAYLGEDKYFPRVGKPKQKGNIKLINGVIVFFV